MFQILGKGTTVVNKHSVTGWLVDWLKVKCAILLLGIGGVLISLPKAMSP